MPLKAIVISIKMFYSKELWRTGLSLKILFNEKLEPHEVKVEMSCL